LPGLASIESASRSRRMLCGLRRSRIARPTAVGRALRNSPARRSFCAPHHLTYKQKNRNTRECVVIPREISSWPRYRSQIKKNQPATRSSPPGPGGAASLAVSTPTRSRRGLGGQEGATRKHLPFPRIRIRAHHVCGFGTLSSWVPTADRNVAPGRYCQSSPSPPAAARPPSSRRPGPTESLPIHFPSGVARAQASDQRSANPAPPSPRHSAIPIRQELIKGSEEVWRLTTRPIRPPTAPGPPDSSDKKFVR